MWLSVKIFIEYLHSGYISPCLERLSKSTRQSLSIFSFRRVTRLFLTILQPRCAIRGHIEVEAAMELGEHSQGVDAFIDDLWPNAITR
jgi:hypothetical protein